MPIANDVIAGPLHWITAKAVLGNRGLEVSSVRGQRHSDQIAYWNCDIADCFLCEFKGFFNRAGAVGQCSFFLACRNKAFYLIQSKGSIGFIHGLEPKNYENQVCDLIQDPDHRLHKLRNEIKNRGQNQRCPKWNRNCDVFGDHLADHDVKIGDEN